MTTEYFSRAGTFTLVDDPDRGRKQMWIMVSSSFIDYNEYYDLTDRQFSDFLADPRLAKRFADECRRREHDDLLMLQPGWNRGTPYMPDESPATQSTIMFYDTATSFSDGYALGFHARTRGRYLSIPAYDRTVLSEEWIHYGVTEDEYTRLSGDRDAAIAFADVCRAGRHDDRLVPREPIG